MSSEFLEVDVDSKGSIVLLSMKASGDAFLTVFGNGNQEFYHLSPNEAGWRNAEIIASALIRWIDHTKQTCKQD